MNVIEINAGTMHPRDPDGTTHTFVCRCLLVHTSAGLVAVDTGIGLQDIASPSERLGDDWLSFARPVLDPGETLARQVLARGHRCEDVTDIVLTHHHRDHVGGLADFPGARIHALPAMHTEVTRLLRTDPHWQQRTQWLHSPRWAPDPGPGEPWRGLPTHRLDGVDSRVRLVPLPGHSVGHAGVLITGSDVDLLHVGDAAFHPGQYLGTEVPALLQAFTASTQHDQVQRMSTELVLGRLAQDAGVRLLTAHGPPAAPEAIEAVAHDQ